MLLNLSFLLSEREKMDSSLPTVPETRQDNAETLTSVRGIPWARLQEEKLRLLTFKKYPQNATKLAILLANNGFAYIGSGNDFDDRVICVFCGKTKQAWREDEDIEQTHRALSPHCVMVIGNDGGNIALSPSGNGSFDRTGVSTHENSRPTRSQQALPENSAELGIVIDKPKTEEYCTYAKRLETFHNHWPKEEIVKSEHLAAAGFYYEGIFHANSHLSISPPLFHL